MTDYEALKAHGHTPAKAAEIILDAKRGDEFCRKWIACIQQIHRGRGAAEQAAPNARNQEQAA